MPSYDGHALEGLRRLLDPYLEITKRVTNGEDRDLGMETEVLVIVCFHCTLTSHSGSLRPSNERMGEWQGAHPTRNNNTTTAVCQSKYQVTVPLMSIL